MLTEGGQNLSGGQRQRLAVARALLTEAPILVLDEPTSAQDALHENHLTETLMRLKGKRTIVLVSHKINTVRDCDLICVLDGGRIAEMGTHDELVMRAHLGDAPAVEHADEIAIADRVDLVAYQHDRTLAFEPHERLGEMILVQRVLRTRRLIEDEDRRLGQKRARDREALALSAGEILPALGEHRIVAAWQPGDEAVDAGQARGAANIGRRRFRAAGGDVLD